MKTHKKNGSPLWITLCILVGIFAIMWFLPTDIGKKTSDVRLMKQFWRANAQPITTALAEGTYGNPEIENRYRESADRIKKQYGRFEVSISTSYLTANRGIVTTSVKSNEATIIFVLPKMVDAYKKLEKTGGPEWQRRFEQLLVTNYIHELDALANATPFAKAFP